ncbi:transposase domain-containing protein [Nocardia rhamnosiphila]
MVDEVLVATAHTERRRRLLPPRMVVYFAVAITLHFDKAQRK